MAALYRIKAPAMTHAPDARGEGHELPELRLKAREDRRLAAGHLWIFSNEVDTERTPLSGFATGALCRVVGDRDRFMGYAYVPHALICARISIAMGDIRRASRYSSTACRLRSRSATLSAPFCRRSASPTACPASCSIATAT
jgi:23S rRNA (cytosine1962-C5)-methyltransferase